MARDRSTVKKWAHRAAVALAIVLFSGLFLIECYYSLRRGVLW